MYFLCTAQPETPETRDKNYFGGFLTVKEKRGAIDSFYRDNENIPLCMDHVAPEAFGSSVPTNKRVGRVVDLFMDKDGDLMAKCILTYDNEQVYKTVMQDIVKKRIAWGVSVRIDWSMPEGEDGPVHKQYTHIALTQSPYLGEHGSYIHHMAFDEKTIDKVVVREYLNPGDGECYASQSFLDRVGLQARPIPALVDCSSARHQLMSDANIQEQVNAPTQPQQQQVQQQEDIQQQQQQQKKVVDPEHVRSLAEFVQERGPNASKTLEDDVSIKQLEDEHAEFRRRIEKAGMTIDDCPDEVQVLWLEQKRGITTRKNKVKNNIIGSVGLLGLTAEDAKKITGLIDGTGYDPQQKKPFVATLEASWYKFEKSEQERNMLLKRNRTVEDKNAELTTELDEMRKKIKSNDYVPFNSTTSSHSATFTQQLQKQQQPPSTQLGNVVNGAAASNPKKFNLFCGDNSATDNGLTQRITDSHRLDSFPLDELWFGMETNERVQSAHDIFKSMIRGTSA